MTWNLESILRRAREQSASDVHLVRGIAPAVRIGGDIQVLGGEPLDRPQLETMLEDLLNDKQRRILEEQWQLCFSRHWEGVGRCRHSIYYHAGCPEMAIRLCEIRVRSREDLGLPVAVEEFTRMPNGLVLVTGPTGTGKTTTLNFMLDVINRDAPRQDRDHRGPRRVRPRKPAEHRRPARGVHGHPVVQAGADPCTASGPGRDRGGRDVAIWRRSPRR